MTAVVGAETRKSQRFGLIDAYRGLAILSVLVFHFTVCFQSPPGPEDLYGYSHHYAHWLEAGRYGVHVFFVISGLVITMTLLRSRDALDFARRRFARIYPAFAVAVLATSACVAATGFSTPPVTLGEVLANLALAAPHLGSRWVDHAYWSLLVEVKFYLVVCASYAVLKRRFWAGVCAYALAAAALARLHTWTAHDLFISDDMPFFLVGMAAWLAFFEKRPGPALACGALGAALYAYYNLAFGGDCTAMKICMHASAGWVAQLYVLGAIGSMLVLMAAGVRDGPAPLVWLGRISYSVYLIHQMFGLVLIRWVKSLGGPDALAMGSAFAVAIGFGWLMFIFVEQPGQRLFQAVLGPRPRPTPAAQPEANQPIPA